MKLDRMIGILSILLQRERVTAPELAEMFEVSRRTINRDVDALCRAGIPIRAQQGAGGGLSIMEGYRVERTVLTGADMQAILAGLRSLDSVSGTRRYAQLMTKLSAGAPEAPTGDDCVRIDLASWYKGPLSRKIGLIRAAIDAARLIEFHYYAPSGESARVVEPYYLAYQWSSWYVYGWCRTRGDWRLFKLNRITDLRLSDGFERREARVPDFDAQKVFPERYRARIRVEAAQKWRLIEEYGPDCFTALPDGRLLFEGGFVDRDHLLTWVLSFGGGAELLAPEELRADLRRLAEKLGRMYADDGTAAQQ